MMIYSKQKGLASVEMVMVLPIFLFFFLLIASIGKFWHIKLDNQVNARTEAWREAMFDSLPDVVCDLENKLAPEQIADRLRANDQLVNNATFGNNQGARDATNFMLSPAVNALACKGNTKNEQDYRRSTVLRTTQSGRNLDRKAQQYRSHFLGELNKTSEQPYAVTGRAYYLWAEWKFKDKYVFLLEDYHVLDVNGSYQRVDLPFGHDDYIERFLIRD